MATEFFNHTFKITNSAIKQFNAIKPYHTHVLEIVEQYVFSESITVNVTDVSLIKIIYAPKPDCVEEGWGSAYDSIFCGYGAGNCCEPFTCTGGFGLSWDNTNLFASYDVVSTGPEDAVVNLAFNSIVVPGNLTQDITLPIVGYPGVDGNTIRVSGGDITWFTGDGITDPIHMIFEVINRRANEITAVNTITNSFTVANVSEGDIDSVSTIVVDGVEHRVTVLNTFVAVADTVTVMIDPATYTVSSNDIGGSLLTYHPTGNAGTYQLWSGFLGYDEGYESGPGGPIIDPNVVSIGDNGDLLIKVEGGFPTPTEFNIGSIILRTALIYPRMITINGGTPTTVISSTYDAEFDQTTIVVAAPLDPALETVGPFTINLNGYDSGAGFDGFPECVATTNTLLGPILNEAITIEYQDSTPPTLFRIAQSSQRYSSPVGRTVIVRGSIDIARVPASDNTGFGSWINSTVVTYS